MFLFIISVSCNNGSDYSIVASDSTTTVASKNDTLLVENCNEVGDEMASACLALDKGAGLWEEFRQRFPYHIQLTGYSELEPDRSCVLLLSEPRPGVTEENLHRLLKCYSHKIDIKTHQIGYDGWVKDVIVTVAGVGPSDLEELKEKLNKYMFGTSEGAYSLLLQPKYSTNYSAALGKDFNYQIAPNELESWFCGIDAVRFENGTIPAILNNQAGTGRGSLHYSLDRGFIAWVLRKGSYLQGDDPAIRQFALDADMIVGVIAKNNNIAIIGRERQSSVFDLPPLRTETILQLAAANDKELAQSYERNNIMACKLPDGKDWAPIYLSDELLNTEYGSLLNITDQLLKSWSQNGETRYIRFPYKDPANWGFSRSLSRLIEEKLGSSSLTFNWNTTGAVYLFTNNEDYDIVGFNRIGSLPVSYIPDESSSIADENYMEIEPYEQKGYKFFSSCNDANLIRAAQYAALYQIFKAFNIKYYNSSTSHFDTFHPLNEQALLFIRKIQKLSGDEINNLVKAAFRKIFNDIGMPNSMEDPDVQYEIETNISAMQNLQQQFANLDDNSMLKRSVINLLVNRNALQSGSLLGSLNNQVISSYERINNALSKVSFLKHNFKLLNIDPNKLLDEFVKYNEASPASWIKTPSVVVSWNKDAIVSYGGHNIDAELLKVEIDYSVRKGKVKIDEGIIRIHPEDKARLTPDMLRKFGVEAKSNKIKMFGQIEEFSFAGGPPRPPRNIKTVFRDPDAPLGKRGFISGTHDVLEVRRSEKNTYIVGDKHINSCEDLHALLIAHSTQDKNTAIEFIDFSKNSVELRLKGVELDIKMGKGMSGEFRKLNFGETMVLNNNTEMGSINRMTYVFEKKPVPGLSNSGDEIIGVELTHKNTQSSTFVHVRAKIRGVFGKIKDAFLKAFSFSKNNDVDFVKTTYKELLAAGIRKNDFSIIVSNSKDCVMCKNTKNKPSVIYAAAQKKELHDGLEFSNARSFKNQYAVCK